MNKGKLYITYKFDDYKKKTKSLYKKEEKINDIKNEVEKKKIK